MTTATKPKYQLKAGAGNPCSFCGKPTINRSWYGIRACSECEPVHGVRKGSGKKRRKQERPQELPMQDHPGRAARIKFLARMVARVKKHKGERELRQKGFFTTASDLAHIEPGKEPRQ